MNNPNGLLCCKCSNAFTISCELSGWNLIEYIVFCHTLWWISYYFLLIVTKQSEEWCCRLLTLFHGCLISYHSLRDAYINKIRIDFKKTPLSPAKKNYLSYMFSYFLFDFFWIHFFGNEAKIIYAHHIVSILIIFNILMRNIGGAGIAYGAAGLEMTNPYLQLRWFLRTHGHQDKPIHKIIELWFIFLFSVIRIIGGTILVYYAVLHSDMDYVTKLSFILIYGISLVLQWQIFVFFRKKYLLAGNRALFIHSRVSISLYFQRRTLDQYERNYDDDSSEDLEESEADKESPKSASTPRSSTGEGSTPARSINDGRTSVSSVNARRTPSRSVDSRRTSVPSTNAGRTSVTSTNAGRTPVPSIREGSEIPEIPQTSENEEDLSPDMKSEKNE